MAISQKVYKALRTTLQAAVTLFACSSIIFSAPARQADSFMDSIGVCVHMFMNGLYTNNYSFVKSKLLAANIRHVRDDLAVDRPIGTAAWKDMAASGIKIGFILNQAWATVDTYRSYLKTNGLISAADYFEGPNEFDGAQSNWVSVLSNYQADIYTKMKGDPETASIPVIAPSFIINHASYRSNLGNISAIADYGNCHPYPGGAMPSTSQTTNEIAACAITTGTNPVFITEIGYQNATNTTNGHHPASELAAGIYLPRIYFDMFSRGIVRTYYYQFLDHITDGGALTNVEAYFGLIRYDLSDKPAYTALKNMTALVKDPGPSFTPAGLVFTVSGTPVKTVLLQKRDGSFYLALWREVSVWNNSSRTNIIPPASNVTVTLPGAYTVAVYSPTDSSNALQNFTNVSSMTLSLQGEVKVLKIESITSSTNRIITALSGVHYKKDGVSIVFIDIPDSTEGSVYSLTGRMIATLTKDARGLVWNVSGNARTIPGVYLCRLRTLTETKIVKVIMKP
ncbi:MAG: hypothetical protein HZC28_06285 [Spirochaetes bacterium]|nr:hypothetical protein [Spirochaetota bacterium]